VSCRAGWPATSPRRPNPQKAKQLLAEAGYPSGVQITLAQVSSWSQKWQDMNQIIQAEAAEAGFDVKINTMDESAYFAQRKAGTIDAYAQTWSADFNDPDNFYYTFFSKSGSAVRAYNNDDPVAFDGVEKARSMTDPGARCKFYQELSERIVQKDAAWVPLFSLDHGYVVQPRVKDFVVPWNGWSDMTYYKVDVE
jgi:ABC-type transport system substrate-binding protein